MQTYEIDFVPTQRVEDKKCKNFKTFAYEWVQLKRDIGK
jgi:hypothetical protein